MLGGERGEVHRHSGLIAPRYNRQTPGIWRESLLNAQASEARNGWLVRAIMQRSNVERLHMKTTRARHWAAFQISQYHSNTCSDWFPDRVCVSVPIPALAGHFSMTMTDIRRARRRVRLTWRRARSRSAAWPARLRSEDDHFRAGRRHHWRSASPSHPKTLP